MRDSGRWGILFDWDGVVVDSSLAHEESWEKLAQEEKKPLPAGHFKVGFGRKNEFIISKLLGWTSDPEEIQRISLRKEALYRLIVKQKGLSPLSGVRELIEALRRNKIPFAIASSTHLENIRSVLEVIGLAGYFSAVVSSEDVRLGKPHPEVFLKAAEKIKCLPRRCIVFEDTPVGLQAARRGGMKTVGVLTSHSPEALRGADRLVYRLDELDLASLSGLIENR